jgi:alpha-galactosidase
MIQVGGYEPCTVTDFEVPKKYGLRQTIADTLGIGGIFRALRTIPVILDMCKDMESVCPDTWFLNYVNPMAINTGAVLKATKINTVGLCHGIQGSAWWLSHILGVPLEELTFLAGGVNHMAYFLKLEHKGVDLYPKLKEITAEGGEFYHRDPVRFEMMKRFGYYGGESSEHTAEYVPFFIRRDREELIKRFDVPLDEYPRRCVEIIESWEKMREKMLNGEDELKHERSSEYGSYIIHSIHTGTPRVIYGNVLNYGSITNLPDKCCVEVPCLVDRNGIQPTVIGDLPPQVAALVRSQVSVQDLTTQAALTGKKEYVYHAAMMDPHTAAELTMDEIHSLVDDLFEAHGNWIPPMS